MKTYSPVDFTKCKYAAAAQAMNKGLDGLQAANGWDLPKAIAEVTKKSGCAKLTIQQIRNGTRNPTRAADGVAQAIEDLGGPNILFPSQVGATSTGSSTPGPHQGNASSTLPFTVTLPAAAGGFRVEVVVNVTPL